MKKIINKLLIFTLVLATTFSCSDPDNVIYTVEDGYTYGAFLRTLSVGANYNSANMNSEFNVTIEAQDENYGALLESMDVYVSFIDRQNDGVDNNKPDALVKSISASEFSPSAVNQLPSTSVTVTLGEALSALGLQAGQFTGGDIITMRLALNTTDGRSFTNTQSSVGVQSAYYASPYAYSTVIQCAPYPGVWTINMRDTYGDGWQTTNGDAGDPVEIQLDNGTVIEFGLCSPYDSSAFNCTPNDGSSGSTTITIPEGTLEALWYFPGDYWGEIEMDIIAPDGTLVYSMGTGTAAGYLPVALCAP